MLKTTAAATVTLFISYCFYFDYKRRTCSEFRRSIKQQYKQLSLKASNSNTTITNDTIPTTQKEIEEYFMLNLQQGEQLMLGGPMQFQAASECFLRALRVYPDPQKLLQVLSQSLPQEVVEMIIAKMKMELSAGEQATIEEIE